MGNTILTWVLGFFIFPPLFGASVLAIAYITSLVLEHATSIVTSDGLAVVVDKYGNITNVYRVFEFEKGVVYLADNSEEEYID